MRRWFFLLVVVAALGPIRAGASTVSLTSTATGWYQNTGFHSATTPNYAAGQQAQNQLNPVEITNDFFVFNLQPGLGTIVGATLVVNNPDYLSTNPTETLVFHDVSTPVSTLVATQFGAISIFNDLASGIIFGSRAVSLADDATNVNFSLNANAIAALNGAIGGPWAIGGTISPITLPVTSNEMMFGNSGSLPAHLVLQTVPEPSAIVLLGVGAFALVGLVRRKMRIRWQSMPA